MKTRNLFSLQWHSYHHLAFFFLLNWFLGLWTATTLSHWRCLLEEIKTVPVISWLNLHTPNKLNFNYKVIKCICLYNFNKLSGFQHGYLGKQHMQNCNIPASCKFLPNWPVSITAEKERTSYQISEKWKSGAGNSDILKLPLLIHVSVVLKDPI